MKNFIQPGNTLTWTNGTGAAVASGAVVVVGNQLAVAAVDIADGASGEVATEGVYTLPKVSAAVIAAGEWVGWDVSAGAFDVGAAIPDSGDVTKAVVWAAAGNGVTSLPVKIGVGVGTVA